MPIHLSWKIFWKPLSNPCLQRIFPSWKGYFPKANKVSWPMEELQNSCEVVRWEAGHVEGRVEYCSAQPTLPAHELHLLHNPSIDTHHHP